MKQMSALELNEIIKDEMVLFDSNARHDGKQLLNELGPFLAGAAGFMVGEVIGTKLGTWFSDLPELQAKFDAIMPEVESLISELAPAFQKMDVYDAAIKKSGETGDISQQATGEDLFAMQEAFKAIDANELNQLIKEEHEKVIRELQASGLLPTDTDSQLHEIAFLALAIPLLKVAAAALVVSAGAAAVGTVIGIQGVEAKMEAAIAQVNANLDTLGSIKNDIVRANRVIEKEFPGIEAVAEASSYTIEETRRLDMSDLQGIIAEEWEHFQEGAISEAKLAGEVFRAADAGLVNRLGVPRDAIFRTLDGSGAAKRIIQINPTTGEAIGKAIRINTIPGTTDPAVLNRVISNLQKAKVPASLQNIPGHASVQTGVGAGRLPVVSPKATSLGLPPGTPPGTPRPGGGPPTPPGPGGAARGASKWFKMGGGIFVAVFGGVFAYAAAPSDDEREDAMDAGWGETDRQFKEYQAKAAGFSRRAQQFVSKNPSQQRFTAAIKTLG